jgi:hypothetical protein
MISYPSANVVYERQPILGGGTAYSVVLQKTLIYGNLPGAPVTCFARCGLGTSLEFGRKVLASKSGFWSDDLERRGRRFGDVNVKTGEVE